MLPETRWPKQVRTELEQIKARIQEICPGYFMALRSRAKHNATQLARTQRYRAKIKAQ